MKKHIQASGAKQGQWVNCNATGTCRNGGTHITDSTFNDAHDWLAKNYNKKPKYQVTEKDISDYKKAVVEGYKPSREMIPEERNKAFAAEVANLRQAALKAEAKQNENASLDPEREARYKALAESAARLRKDALGEKTALKALVSRFADYREVEKSLARGESPQGEGQFQIGIIMRRGFRRILDESGITYKETKLGGASKFELRFSGARQARAYAHISRQVHWMESEDTARKYEEFRNKLRSENRKKLFNRSKRVPIPLGDWSEEAIANGLFDGAIIKRANPNGSIFLEEA